MFHTKTYFVSILKLCDYEDFHAFLKVFETTPSSTLSFDVEIPIHKLEGRLKFEVWNSKYGDLKG